MVMLDNLVREPTTVGVNKNISHCESVITVEPWPAPMMLNALFAEMVLPDHVTVPAWILMVSPAEPFETQVLTLAWSGVEVHVGLFPVHCARTKVGNSRTTAPRRNLL